MKRILSNIINISINALVIILSVLFGILMLRYYPEGRLIERFIILFYPLWVIIIFTVYSKTASVVNAFLKKMRCEEVKITLCICTLALMITQNIAICNTAGSRFLLIPFAKKAVFGKASFSVIIRIVIVIMAFFIVRAYITYLNKRRNKRKRPLKAKQRKQLMIKRIITYTMAYIAGILLMLDLSYYIVAINTELDIWQTVEYEVDITGRYVNGGDSYLELDTTNLDIGVSTLEVTNNIYTHINSIESPSAIICYHKGLMGIPWVEVTGFTYETKKNKTSKSIYVDGEWITSIE